MKKIFITTVLVGLLMSCDKDTLKLVNPNEPGLEALQTETGIQKAALGVYDPLRYSNGFYYTWFVLTNHNIMGDATVTSVGNFGWRWVNQVASITRPNGTVVNPPAGSSQPVMLEQYNSRDQGTSNPQAHEWVPMYATIGHANLMLSIIDNVQFTGTAAEIATKKKTYEAWFLWWKGFCYSRLGSIYSQALINNTYGEISTTYHSNAEIITEAKRNFEEAKAILATISDSDNTYDELMTSFIPSYFRVGNGGLIKPSMFIRNINSYLARNILVNKYAADLTATELTEIETLANAGIQQTDKIFTIRSGEDSNTCFVYQTAWSPYRILTAWERVSERLVQDFKAGDNRFTRNITLMSAPAFNPGGRGISYGTRYIPVDGGDYASFSNGTVEMPMGITYEETQLMLAEVKIRRGEIDAGLSHIDGVRSHQNAQLTAVSGTGLTQVQALEELRSERRIGLFLKGTAFYDARRWGVLKPVAQGGGRTNANVVVATDGTVEACTIDYNYKEWFDVPAQETDFNPIQ